MNLSIKHGRSGLCASDKSLLHDDWMVFNWGMQSSAQGIVGHEGAGTVVAVGEGMERKWQIGDRAGIKWVYSTCGECDLCQSGGGDELHCPNAKNPGFNQPGTFQEYALADGRYTTKIPDGVSDEEVNLIMSAYIGCYTNIFASRPGLSCVEASPLMLLAKGAESNQASGLSYLVGASPLKYES